MTRKRFIKLGMSIGYSRNEANERAESARRVGISYATAWEYEIAPMGTLRRCCMNLGKGFKRMAKQIRKRVIPAARQLRDALYKLDLADDAMEPAPMWPKENPHMDGLRIHHSFVDEMAAYRPALTREQIEDTTAKNNRILACDGKLVNQDAFVTIIPVAGGGADGN